MRSKIIHVSSLALLSAALLFGAACRGGGYSPAPAPPPEPLPPVEPVPPPVDSGSLSMSDEAIHDRVHEALDNAPDLDASDISVRVEAGNVYLSGTVPTAAQRDLAHNVAHGVEGVQRVFYDDLRVR